MAISQEIFNGQTEPVGQQPIMPAPSYFPAEGPTQPEYAMAAAEQEAKSDEVKALYSEYESLRASMDARREETNIAAGMTLTERTTIAMRVIEDYHTDLSTLDTWRRNNAEFIKMATVVAEGKTNSSTGEKMSNVKMPMIAMGIQQFAARVYPEVVRGNKVVQYVSVGLDADGKKSARSKRLEDFENDQFLNRIAGWERDESLACCMVAASGVAIKKTFRNSSRKTNVSCLVMPNKFVVNYHARSLEDARRLTEEIDLYRNDIVAYQNADFFLKDFNVDDLGRPTGDSDRGGHTNDDDAPHVFLEQHRWLDLDGDGYEEPYIVTIHRDTQRLVRISARWDSLSVEYAQDGSITHIEPTHFYTIRILMDSPDGCIFGMGLSALMFTMSAAVNDSVNMLLDAGGRQCEPSGFLGRGFASGRAGMGGAGIVLRRGEWKQVSNTGDELRKNIVQVEIGQPSPVLFQLLGFLSDLSKEISMTASKILGDSPSANVPVGTTRARIEEGLKTYSAAFKRTYLSLKEEYKKNHRLNRLYLLQDDYMKILDDPKADKAGDFETESCDVQPIADPTCATDIQRSLKEQELASFQGLGLNDMAIIKRRLELLRVENIEELMQATDKPGSDLEQKLKEAEIELKDSQRILNLATADVRQYGKVLDKTQMMIDAKKKDIELKSQKNDALDKTEPTGRPSKDTNQGPYEERGLQSNNLQL